MDRPLGPRQPDKRLTAYESIFGRPSVSHHLSSGPGQSSTQNYPPPPIYSPNQYPYPSNPQQHHSSTSIDPHNTSYSSHPYLPQPPPPNPQSVLVLSKLPYLQSQYPHHQPSLPPLPNNPLSQGVYPPQTDDPSDFSLDSLTRQGLTPAQAQAYQAQAYPHQQGPWGPRSPPIPQQQQQPQQPAYEYEHDFRYQNGAATRSHTNIPQLGVNIDTDNGRLGIDFAEESSPSDTDDSELPWANSRSSSKQPHHSYYQNPQPTPAHHRLSQRQSPPDSLSIRSTDSGYSGASAPPSKPYSLQLDTALMSQANRSGSSSTTTYVDASAQGSSTRRSSESSRTMPGPSRRDRSLQDRSRSLSANPSAHVRSSLADQTTAPSPASTSSRARPGHSPQVQGNGPPSSPTPYPRRSPIVYPALLSRVAEALRARIVLSDIVKDGLTYKNAFDGRQAVDKIAYIIKTTDRNLALLLGRALDAQKYFHAVTYDHRLRDSASDVYQFRTRVGSPFHSGELSPPAVASPGSQGTSTPTPDARELGVTRDTGSPSNEASTESDQGKHPDESAIPTAPSTDATEDILLPTGVFTLLTDCYSPTCSRDRLCYSITCPRRLEQQSRLNMKPQPGLGIKRQLSRESLGDPEHVEPGLLWIHTVSKEIVDSVSDQEKRRQEAINEVIYTERDFVRDMEYLRDVWIAPLNTSDIIPEHRRADFIEQVFWNILDVIAVNTRLRDALNKRQKSHLLDIVPHFAPFVSYGAHQLYGKYEFEKEKSSNLAFAQFVEETERRPDSRKLELNAYLTKPTTRLARYPLLLEAVLKNTPEECADKQDIPKVVKLVREFLAEVNHQTGRAENRFNLLQLEKQLLFRPGEQVDLRLREEGREMIFKGPLKRRGGSQGDSGELLVFLLDHALLMVKQKSKADQYKVYRPPIPLELLLVIATDETGMRPIMTSRPQRNSTGQNGGRRAQPYPPVVPVKFEGGGKAGFSITFVHLGRKFYQMTLWAATHANHRKWVENITRQQDLMRERNQFFEMETLSESFFQAVNRANCAAPFSGGNKVAYGTFDGVYFQDLREPSREPIKVLALTDVAQVDVLDDYGLLIVLSEGQVITFPLDALEAMDPLAGLKRAKRIAAHTSFFKSGVCVGRTFVCVVKTSPLSSTIKIFEPIDQNVRGRNKPTFRKLLQGGNDTLRIYKEFYIPVQSSSIHFLRTKLCVACVNGFEIIDPDTLDTQGLLDPSDESLDFVRRRGDNTRPKPVAIYRIENEFLLCYDEFAFYINRGGRRSRKNFLVYWEGAPTSFAFQYPYVLAFEPTFVEIRNVETGLISQVIQGNNLRCLFNDMPPSMQQTHPRTSQSSFSSYSGSSFTHVNAPYAPHAYNGRASLPGVYGSSPVPMYPGQPPPPPHARAAAREEVILVSDDRVLTLRMVALPGQ
ncbi:CNH domain-containing protein [Multifurca ochricompacta]|uniref:CNH domain-containing protein n=1 Tax=Multifurca ochricompacta TaxID=376703 RepID=A0AAD4M942_9AGAM|nr:CNH domain-containing protein [Multifurca ochricompacta]